MTKVLKYAAVVVYTVVAVFVGALIGYIVEHKERDTILIQSHSICFVMIDTDYRQPRAAYCTSQHGPVPTEIISDWWRTVKSLAELKQSMQAMPEPLPTDKNATDVRKP